VVVIRHGPCNLLILRVGRLRRQTLYPAELRARDILILIDLGSGGMNLCWFGNRGASVRYESAPFDQGVQKEGFLTAQTPFGMTIRQTKERCSSFDNLVADGVKNQFADGVQFELAHDVGAMGLGGFHADAKGHGHFFTALAFGE
jgi:hypothetical protein